MKKTIEVTKGFRGLETSLAFCFGVLCLSGCGTTSTFRDPIYTKQEFKSGPVAFIPMRFTEIGMEAYEEFRKAFKNEPESGGETTKGRGARAPCGSTSP